MVAKVDKSMTLKEVVSQIKNGDTIAIGGWGPVRKPMALIREIAKSKKKDLTILSPGGLDVDLLLGAGKVKKLIACFMSLEGAPSEIGNYRRMRKEGTLEMSELSEHMTIAGLKAAAERLPFYPTRSGAFTDLMKINPDIQYIEAPYTGETLVAMPAFKIDVTLLHINAATKSGYGQIIADPAWDAHMARATAAQNGKIFLEAERIITVEEMKCAMEHMHISIVYVTGVVEAPYGAHPGKIFPDYDWDEAHLAEYRTASADPEAFKAYLDKYVNVPDSDAYLKLVGK